MEPDVDVIYVWKNNLIEFPMEPVPHQNSFGVIGNRRNKLTFRICLGVASPYFGLWAMYHVGVH
jgi:hypothetical protein